MGLSGVRSRWRAHTHRVGRQNRPRLGHHYRQNHQEAQRAHSQSQCGVRFGLWARPHRSDDRTARVWDTRTGKTIKKLKGHTVVAVCNRGVGTFSPGRTTRPHASGTSAAARAFRRSKGIQARSWRCAIWGWARSHRVGGPDRPRVEHPHRQVSGKSSLTITPSIHSASVADPTRLTQSSEAIPPGTFCSSN